MCSSDLGRSGGDGTFTVTGIPSEYNGQYAFFTGGDSDLGIVSWEKIGTLEKNSRISNGRVVLPLWIQLADTGSVDDFVKYSGDHTLVVTVYIFSSESELFSLGDFVYFNSIEFSNGSATRAWRDGEVQNLRSLMMD